MASMGEHSADTWLTCIDEWCRSTYNDFSVEEWRPFLKHATPKWINPSAQKPMMKPQMSFSISQIDILNMGIQVLLPLGHFQGGKMVVSPVEDFCCLPRSSSSRPQAYFISMGFRESTIHFIHKWNFCRTARGYGLSFR
jgi:hypothetical protein